MNIQDWSPLGWTSWISLQSKVMNTTWEQTEDILQKKKYKWLIGLEKIAFNYNVTD